MQDNLSHIMQLEPNSKLKPRFFLQFLRLVEESFNAMYNSMYRSNDNPPYINKIVRLTHRAISEVNIQIMLNSDDTYLHII